MTGELREVIQLDAQLDGFQERCYKEADSDQSSEEADSEWAFYKEKSESVDTQNSEEA